MLANVNLLGALVAVIFFVFAILVFVFRLFRKSEYAHWLGYLEFFLALPLIYLLITGPRFERPSLYYIQIGCALAWLALEALLDYILKVEFRSNRWAVVGYVMLFFAGSGGLLGVASEAGMGWMIASSILFLVMAVLTFLQRGLTGY